MDSSFVGDPGRLQADIATELARILQTCGRPLAWKGSSSSYRVASVACIADLQREGEVTARNVVVHLPLFVSRVGSGPWAVLDLTSENPAFVNLRLAPSATYYQSTDIGRTALLAQLASGSLAAGIPGSADDVRKSVEALARRYAQALDTLELRGTRQQPAWMFA